MKAWHLNKHDTVELYDRVYALENKVRFLESERADLEKLLKHRWDNAVEKLLPVVEEKCFVKVYQKEMLVSLLKLAEKAKDEKEENG